MMVRRLGSLLLQCAASQQWTQCCWMGAAACLSTTASAAADATAVRKPSSSPKEARRSSQSKWPVANEQLLALSFDQLHKNIQQQFALQSPQTESKLLLLISKASSKEQVQAAVAAVQHNHMKRCRIRQAQPLSTQVFNALYKAGNRAGMGHGFAVQLLEQANLLGLQTSRSICEEVVLSCIKQKDYPAASLAWLYAKTYCSEPSPSASAAAAGAGAPWASKSLIRLYSTGMSKWLAEGGVSKGHQRRLRQELQQLAQELVERGAKMPKGVKQLLQEKSKVVQGGHGGGAAAAEPAAAEPAAAEQAAAQPAGEAPA